MSRGDRRPEETSPRSRSSIGWILGIVVAAIMAYLLTTVGAAALIAVGIGQAQSIAQQECTLDLGVGGGSSPPPAADPNRATPDSGRHLEHPEVELDQQRDRRSAHHHSRRRRRRPPGVPSPGPRSQGS